MKERPLQSDFRFRLMALEFCLRDLVRPPLRVLHEADIRPSMTILDFGCGPGSFSVAAARLVGPRGRVFAVDVSQIALRHVERAAARQRLTNIRIVLGSDLAGIEDECVDVALLYDVLHDIVDPAQSLAEMHRVLKPEGTLSVSDHHLKDEALLAVATARGLFTPTGRGRWTHRFMRARANKVAT
jgi:ubiquinone/menaquinone biosynthesis C-methylase UbiE